MSRKKLLIDLSVLRHPYCGLGQIALNYGRWYQNHVDEWFHNLDITLLVPRNYLGHFGNEVHYLLRNDARRICPWLMPRYDIWHSTNQMSAFRPWSLSTRHIMTIHDVNFLYEKTGAKFKKYQRKIQLRCDHASEFTFISHFAMQDSMRVLDIGGKPTQVIYNGVENMTIGNQEQPASMNADQRFFLTLGEVKEKKNIHSLLPLMDRLQDYQLVVAGNDGTEYAAHLRSLLPQHPNVMMLGKVSDNERRWLYAHCSALLFPSIAEGFGLPIIEAMQWGKPVFCSDKTSLPEIGSTHAHYFTDFDPDHMADLVKNGLQQFSPEKAMAAQNYAASFNYDRHMRQYLELYLKD